MRQKALLIVLAVLEKIYSLGEISHNIEEIMFQRIPGFESKAGLVTQHNQDVANLRQANLEIEQLEKENDSFKKVLHEYRSKLIQKNELTKRMAAELLSREPNQV